MSKSAKEDEQMLSRLEDDFHDLLDNKETFHESLEGFLNNIIDELTLGIIFDLHRKYKTTSYDTDKNNEDELCRSKGGHHFASQDSEIECTCPVCDRSLGYAKFAGHLRSCMGYGRKKYTRRTATTTNNRDSSQNTSFSGMPTSDDDDDLDWNSVNKRGKKKKRTNGNKKPKGGTPKKNDTRIVDTTVGMEVDDELLNLMHDQSISPTDSLSSNQSTNSRKKEKNKSKKKRSSPTILA